MGAFCSSLCKPKANKANAYDAQERYGENELMEDVEFDMLLRADDAHGTVSKSFSATDDADLLMSEADTVASRGAKSEWERNPRVLSNEEIHNITKAKIEEIVRQQAEQDRLLSQKYADEEERLRLQEEAEIEEKRQMAKQAKQLQQNQQVTGASPSQNDSSSRNLSRMDSGPSFMSPDMKRWLESDSDATVLLNAKPANVERPSLLPLVQNQSTKSEIANKPAAEVVEDFDAFLENVKATVNPSTNSAAVSLATSTIPAATSAATEMIASANTFTPPPMSPEESSNTVEDASFALSPELLQVMQATQNAESFDSNS